MPLIMEDGINVDDLFGESASLELGLPPNTPPAKGLAQRLDEMRLVGCCQYVALGNPRIVSLLFNLTLPRKIAWSRLGCVAYISQDASRVNVRHLQCQKSDGKWTLSDETPLNQVADAHDGHSLVHLCWNESGSELAIADTSGRVSIYSIPIALNSVNGARQAAFDAADDGAQIVGMTWLNQNRSVSILCTQGVFGLCMLNLFRYTHFIRLPRYKVVGHIRHLDDVQLHLSTPLIKPRSFASQGLDP